MRTKRTIKNILILCLATYGILGVAKQKNDSTIKLTNNNNHLETYFDTKAADKIYTKISIKLSTQNLKLKSLEKAAEEITVLRDQAASCVQKTQEQLTTLQKLFEESKLSSVQKNKNADFKYLQNKKEHYEKQQTACRLFVFRSNETLEAFNDTILKLSTSKIISKTHPIWTFFNKTMLTNIWKIDSTQILNGSGINSIDSEDWLVLAIFMSMGIGLGIFIRQVCKKQLLKYKDTKVIYADFLYSLKMFIIPMMLFAVCSIFFKIIFYELPQNPSLELVSQGVLAYILIMMVSKFLFHPSLEIDNPIKISHNMGKAFFIRLTVIYTVLLLTYSIATIFREQEFSMQEIELSNTLYILALCISIIWLVKLFTKIKCTKQSCKILRSTATISFNSLLSIIIIIEFLGYHKLSIFLFDGFLLSFIAIGVVWAWTNLLKNLNNVLDNKKYKASAIIRYYCDIKEDRKFLELYIIRYAIYLITAIALFLLLLNIWGLSPNNLQDMQKKLIDGFTVMGMKIMPSRIIAALIMFSFFNAIGKAISAYFSRRRRSHAEKDIQDTLASVVHYISFSVALIFAFLIAGVNFTGLAIIAGALSVGIGLGLQNIVNNFVSGLILLIEKPIKPGDRILIENTEGFVKRIRLRSTRISTLLKTDVIIPNSELVSRQVTNFMFLDKMWRAKCAVGVAYGSDVNLVTDTLLKVAHENKNIVQDTPNQPNVYFIQFGDSCLMFELWYVIQNVNDKYRLTSDLHIAVEKAFKENNITIAFPQRDIHIRTSDLVLQPQGK